MHYRSGMAIACVFLAVACGDQPTGARAPSPPVLDLPAVTRAVAGGLSSPAVRTLVRDALRESPYTEHKVSFQDLIASSGGEPLARAAAQAAHVSLGEFRSAVAQLDNLDFYMPIEQQRRTWAGTEGVAVAASAHGMAPAQAYATTGATVPLDLSHAVVPPVALLMLQSAETKSLRVSPQLQRPGLVIQDPGDGQLSGTIVLTDRFGIVRTLNLADVMTSDRGLARQQCYEDCGSGGGGGGTPPPPPPQPETFLQSISTQGVCDNNNCFETNEFEFRATMPNGTTEAIRVEGIPSTGYRYLHVHLIYAVPPGLGYMWVGGEGGSVAARETDSFNMDDFWYSLQTCHSVHLTSANGNANDNAQWALGPVVASCQDPFTYPPNVFVTYSW